MEERYHIRNNRSDDPSRYRSLHWWIETHDGYVKAGPFDSAAEARRYAADHAITTHN